MERDDSDAKLMIEVQPFVATKVRITIPQDQIPANKDNSKGYIGGRVDLRVTEKWNAQSLPMNEIQPLVWFDSDRKFDY